MNDDEPPVIDGQLDLLDVLEETDGTVQNVPEADAR